MRKSLKTAADSLSEIGLRYVAISVILFFLWGGFFLQAQTTDPKAFEGVIEYEVSVKTLKTESVMFKDFFARKMTLRMKTNALRCDYEESGVDSVRLGYVLVLADSNSVFRVLPGLQLIRRKQLNDPHPTEQLITPEVYQNLNRKEMVAGQLCSGYMAETTMPMAGGKVRIITYCADNLHFPVTGNLKEESTLLMLGNGLSGIPLKKILRFEEHNLEVTLRAVRIAPLSVSEEWFGLPQKFRIEQFDRSSQE